MVQIAPVEQTFYQRPSQTGSIVPTPETVPVELVATLLFFLYFKTSPMRIIVKFRYLTCSETAPVEELQLPLTVSISETVFHLFGAGDWSNLLVTLTRLLICVFGFSYDHKYRYNEGKHPKFYILNDNALNYLHYLSPS